MSERPVSSKDIKRRQEQDRVSEANRLQSQNREVADKMEYAKGDGVYFVVHPTFKTKTRVVHVGGYSVSGQYDNITYYAVVRNERRRFYTCSLPRSPQNTIEPREWPKFMSGQKLASTIKHRLGLRDPG